MTALLLVFALFFACDPKGTPVPPEGGLEAAARIDVSCVPEQEPITPNIPWSTVDQLCADPRIGQPWTEVLPPTDTLQDETYALALQKFLRSEAYKKPPYSWHSDANWRLTGPFKGCSCPPGSPDTCKPGSSQGPHPAVRMYYSPEVITWLCTYRRGEEQLPDASAIPDGAMIIKEMLSPTAVKLARVPGTNQLWVAPPNVGQPSYDQAYTAWTVMIKQAGGSADGWFWTELNKTSSFNPPIQDRSAFTAATYPGSDGQPVTEPPGCEWYPTYWQYSVNDVQFPNYGAGNYCIYCHGSAVGEQTFSSLTNLLGQENRYDWTPALPSVSVNEHMRSALAPTTSGSSNCPSSPFPSPNSKPSAEFTSTFPQLSPSFAEVWATRFPSQTWDHTVSYLGVDGKVASHSQFLTSDQCESCHSAGGSGQRAQPYMVEQVGDTQIDLSPWAEWSVSPMGLAGRDPIFFSQLELERNLASTQPGLSSIKDCIDNTCLHCHGAPGARQYNIDTQGQHPKDDACKAFLPPKDQRAATNYDGALFTKDKVMAWRDEDPTNASYGGLARDGVSCTVCHHIADIDLDQKNLSKTFTGNFRVGPPDELYGPFPNEASKEDVLPKPMEHALGITPKHGDQVQSSELCGTCHTVYLPVFDSKGLLAGASYEQTTYLEWLLSSFAGDKNQSCQDCHMPNTYQDKELVTGIANITNSLYPKADFLLPLAEVDNPERPYNRHQLWGLNIFLNAFSQQFPLLMGLRQQNYMNGNVTAPQLIGQESVLQMARELTATVTAGALSWDGNTLVLPVTVQNLGGHSLPSGVGFRRMFIEVQVLDAQGKPLWASGRTNAVGVILDGLTNNPLPTEFAGLGPDGLPFQPHYQEITSGSQVQIYQEVNQDQSLNISSSFLHRYWTLKDNRLRPSGWNPDRVSDAALREEYGNATEPGTGPEQHWWPKPSKPTPYKDPNAPNVARYTDTLGDPDYTLSQPTGLSGADSLVYRITLPAELQEQASTVTVTLYSQSIPPAFLSERFTEAAKPGAESEAAVRLYYMTSTLNTAAVAPDGTTPLAGYRLQIGERLSAQIP